MYNDELDAQEFIEDRKKRIKWMIYWFVLGFLCAFIIMSIYFGSVCDY